MIVFRKKHIQQKLFCCKVHLPVRFRSNLSQISSLLRCIDMSHFEINIGSQHFSVLRLIYMYDCVVHNHSASLQFLLF